MVDTRGKLLGVITRADLLQAIRTSPLMSPEASSGTQPLSRTRPLLGIAPQMQLVTTYLNADVATVEEQTPFAEMIDALIASPLKRVLVIDSERHVKGVISDVDVLAQMQDEGRPHLLTALAELARGRPARLPIGALRTARGRVRVAADVMNRQIVTIAETASIQDAVNVMMSTHRKVLPVLDHDGRLLGTLGRSDVLRLLLEGETEQ